MTVPGSTPNKSLIATPYDVRALGIPGSETFPAESFNNIVIKELGVYVDYYEVDFPNWPPFTQGRIITFAGSSYFPMTDYSDRSIHWLLWNMLVLRGAHSCMLNHLAPQDMSTEPFPDPFFQRANIAALTGSISGTSGFAAGSVPAPPGGSVSRSPALTAVGSGPNSYSGANLQQSDQIEAGTVFSSAYINTQDNLRTIFAAAGPASLTATGPYGGYIQGRAVIYAEAT